MSTCKYCGKTYRRSSYLTKHQLTCEFLSKTPKELRLETEEREDTPSVRQLYEIIMEMTIKYSKLEKKVEELTKYTESKKRKIDVIEWLNNNYSLKTNYNNFISSINLDITHLKLVFETDLITGIYQILLNYLSDINNLPIKAFDQKDNVLFIFNDTWNKIKNEDFIALINIIRKQLNSLLIKWQETNNKKLSNETFAKIYMKNCQKVLGCNLSKEKIMDKLHKDIYKHIKINLKNIVEYEFGF